MPSNLSDREIGEALDGRCNQARLARSLRDLLKPYFAESPEERAREVAIFVQDLAEFSEDVAFWAVREWRLNEDRRPTSAGLRKFCMARRADLVREQRRRAPLELAPPVVRPSSESAARIQALIDRFKTGLRDEPHA